MIKPMTFSTYRKNILNLNSCNLVRYCLRAISLTNDKFCLSCAQTRTRLKILSALNFRFYCHIESISMLNHEENPFAVKSTCILWCYFLWQRLFLILGAKNLDKERMLNTHSIDSIRIC